MSQFNDLPICQKHADKLLALGDFPASEKKRMTKRVALKALRYARKCPECQALLYAESQRKS